MRALRLAVLFVAALLSPRLAMPAGTSGLTISSPKANAGDVETFTITRVTGAQGIYVLFQTADGTAKAGLDYVATKQLIYFKGSQTSATVTVPTLTNPNATGTLTFKAAVASGKVGIGTTASIVEPAPITPWVSAPLHDGGFAKVVTVSDPDWEIEGPGAGRPLVAGEIVAVYFNGDGYDFNGEKNYAIYALSDGVAGRVKGADIVGVAPSGNPPLPPPNLGLPPDWWVPGLVTANKTCANAVYPAQPGVTQGGVYRAAMVIGTHMQLAPGVTGNAGTTWVVFGADDPWQGAREVVTGDCLTGM